MDFHILGPLEVLEDGRSVALGGSKQRALLAILLIHANEALSTDRLIAELWGDDPPATAAKTVQVHISRLRKTLATGTGEGPDSLIVTRNNGYALRVDPEYVDSRKFERLVTEGRFELAAGRAGAAASALETALSLWRGAPLADLAYEAFAQRETARLEDLRVAALEQLIDAKLALGRHAEVLGQLETLIVEHPYREHLYGQLMLALYRCDRQAEALQAYQEARRTLVGELGIEPGARLRELERAILAQDPALHLPAVDDQMGEAVRRAFVGREPELAKLVARLDDARAGRGRLVLVGGEPGIGKSRLMEELIERARTRGTRTLVGRCWEAGGAPAYWPWVQALRSYVRSVSRETLRSQLADASREVAAIFPELRELLPGRRDAPTSDEDARFLLFESLASLLRSAASSEPIAVCLDDLHAADAPSLLLLRFLAAELDEAPILIVGCYRDTEIGPELADALAELSRKDNVQRLRLTGLGRSDTARLVELTAGHPPTAELASQIHAETAGNPLFAAEIGRLFAAEGPHEETSGRLPIPQRVRETIHLRLRPRSQPCRQLLTLTSVVGREFRLDVAQRLSGLQEDELLDLLEEAVAAGLLEGVPGGPGRLRFSHVLIRDTLYVDLPAPRRLRLHRSVAEALEALFAGNPVPHLTELAHHYLEAGSLAPEKAIEFCERAGDWAATQRAFEEAARHFANALRVLETTGSGDDHRICALLLSLGESLTRAGRGSEANETLRRAAAIAEQHGWSDQLARAALGYGGRLPWVRAATDPVLVPLLERALAAVGADDSHTRVRLLTRLAGALRDDPSRDRRAAIVHEALDIARHSGAPATLACALEGFVSMEGPDTADVGLGAGAELIAVARALDDKEREYQGHDNRLHAFWWLADRSGVDVELDSLIALAGQLRQPSHRWWLGATRTALALMEGQFEQAEQLAFATLEVGQWVLPWNAVLSHRIALFVLRREQGRLAEMEDTIARSVHEYPALLRFRCALAHLYAELDREHEARLALDDVMSCDPGHHHLDSEWLFTMALLPDACAYLAHERAAAELYGLLLPREHLYTDAPAEAVFGSLARGLGVLATTLGQFDDAKQHFDAALETERTMRAGPWRAHAHHDLAAMLLARRGPGDARQARTHLDEALSIYRGLGMTHWAARATALAGTAG